MEKTFVIAPKGIIVFNGRALIMQRSAEDTIGPNEWEFAGGKMIFGEGLKDCLIREIKEEVGLTVTVNRLLYAATFKTNDNRQVVILSYLCTAHDDKVTLSDEHQDYLWADKKQMKELLARPILDDLNSNSVWDILKLN